MNSRHIYLSSIFNNFLNPQLIGLPVVILLETLKWPDFQANFALFVGL